MNWLSFFIGMIVGGGIVYYFWRSNAQEARETEQMLRQQRTAAENETRQIKAQFENVKRQEEQLATCQAELQKQTHDLQRVTAQLSTAESQNGTLRDQLAVTGTGGGQLDAAAAQIQTLRDQLAETEAKAATKKKQFSTAKARIRNMNDELAVAGARADQFTDAAAQIQTLQDQLAETEAKAATKKKKFSSAKAYIRDLHDQLAATEMEPEAVMEKPISVMAAEVESAVQPDNLTKIEGIGPKVSQVLNEHKIFTFAQLAQTDVSRLRTILQDAGPRFRMIEPESWPEQAGLAANGNWDALAKLQGELDGGKYRR